MNRGVSLPGVHSTLQNGIAHSRFSVAAEPPQRRLTAWRERVGHVIDVLPSRSDLEKPFNASIDRYELDGLAFTDCRSDAMSLDRSLARISRDSVRSFALHVFVEGEVRDVSVRSLSRAAAPFAAKVLALDMGQPVRMRRTDCRVLTLFVPAAVVEEVFPDPEAIHGLAIEQAETPVARLAVEHVAALASRVGRMNAAAVQADARAGAQLLVAALGRQARLGDSGRAGARAAVFGQARRYIQAHLHRADLSPDDVIAALQLSRPTVYRLFQHEGGLGSYIRHLRLRHAADELARHPSAMVADVGYGAGFKSASDFSRAFRRAYDMSPQDFRALSRKAA
ncbi:helix-turn-helix transcriptional regulator [Variovorax sp. AFSI2.2]|uniref:AraC family transcriptional regulator n=1 Tax=Variovorax sp. AFSI2.2 TaxID=3384160 RepID=UPI003EBC8814